MGIGSRECDEVVEVWDVAREVGGRLPSKLGRVGMRTDCDGRWISMVNAVYQYAVRTMAVFLRIRARYMATAPAEVFGFS